MTQAIDEFALPLPITQRARHTAARFANQQPTPAKAEQVRLNTLAVLVVQDYFELMEIPTQLEASDSWNSLMRLCSDVADLDVAGVGRLECRPVRPEAATCAIPPETWEDRIGYAVVQIDDSIQEAQLLGFLPSAETESLPLSQLRSPEALLDYLYELKQQIEQEPAVSAAIAASIATAERALTNLGDWLRGTIDAGWQAVDSLINPPQALPAFAFRSDRDTAVRRAKSIDLRPQHSQPIALVVNVQPMSEGQTAIYLQLQPTTPQDLPSDLQVTILSDTNEAIASGQADEILEVDGMTGERFQVQIALNGIQIREEFII